MPVYVDEIKDYGATVKGHAARFGSKWSHMMATTREELDMMASRLGLRTTYRQHSGKPTEHYDLIPSKRALAIRFGAIECTGREMITLVVDPKRREAVDSRIVDIRDGDPEAVYIGRAQPQRGLKRSIFANPFKLLQGAFDAERAQVIADYRAYLERNPALLRRLPELRGKKLACWCRREGIAKSPSNACHGDVLLEFLDRYTDEELRNVWGEAE